MKLTFARRAAALSFASMAEGMWENHRDDAVMGDIASTSTAETWGLFVDAVNAATNPDDVTSFELPDVFRPLVKDVIDNCADNAHAMGFDDESDLDENPEDAELACCPWEVTIDSEAPKPVDYRDRREMECREALEEALEALHEKAANTDTASPEGHRARLAIDVIKMMLEQRGLEVFKNGDDGTLPGFCNVVIFG